MSTDAAHKSWWQIAEVVFGIPFLAAIALQFIIPLSLPRGLLRPAFTLGGAALISVGVAFVVLARREFARRGQPTDPGLPTTQVVSTGIFSVSRNPLYLGAICFLAGVALAGNLPWVLVLLLPSFVACHYVLIAPEERYLVARFDEEYRVYAATVHRWFGRARISTRALESIWMGELCTKRNRPPAPASSSVAAHFKLALPVVIVISFPLAMTVMNGERYLVSMLGEEVNWVRNVQAAGGKARLRQGKGE